MPSIKISDLHSVGSDLFSDSESYLSDLNGGEFNFVYGGRWSGWNCVGIVLETVATAAAGGIALAATPESTPACAGVAITLINQSLQATIRIG